MTRIVGLALVAATAFAQSNLDYVLKRVEERYNRAKTLKVSFEEAYTAGGKGRKIERGELYLRKPGKMRWNYSDPEGKLFVSDGKNLYLYTPNGNRAEKMRLKETDDLRAPLAFLLGKLDFHRDFDGFNAKQQGSDIEITAAPKSDKLPYRQVDFVVGPDFNIKHLKVIGQDSSILAFNFANEAMNVAVDNKMFRFKLPPGASFVDETAENREADAGR